jgi:hypothetical protein
VGLSGVDKEITLGPGILPHFTTEENKIMKLREIIKALQTDLLGVRPLCFKEKIQAFVNNSLS